LKRRGIFCLAALLAGTAAAAPPQRIVSLVPGLTESVCALGACALLVGTDRYSNWPAEVKALPKLGGLDDAQVERIAALKPDLVLAAPSARAAERLRSLGLRVVVMHTRSHQDVMHNLQRLGELLEEPARGAAAWAAIEGQMAAAAARVPAGLQGRSVYFEVDATPYAAGQGSFIGQTLQRLGLNNIVPASLGPFPKLSPEFVVRTQPQLIMAETRVLQGMATRPGWPELAALRHKQVCAFSGERYDLVVRAGPRMGAAALQIADCLAGLRMEPR
jgi:iron complex transport system substrate-binding protein